jgi:hypothetical protein
VADNGNGMGPTRALRRRSSWRGLAFGGEGAGTRASRRLNAHCCIELGIVRSGGVGGRLDQRGGVRPSCQGSSYAGMVGGSLTRVMESRSKRAIGNAKGRVCSRWLLEVVAARL